ncbi:MAG: CDP-alcohol phosphatidyltransferase family protein [Thermoanaerobaculaceae bacterium]|jgi:phosphatidylglycerophosphate synthase|nr:CDP-alcohol phosphatidyltransferase family protein [Thermoanaerobaculaceae bacterium]
MPSVYDLKARFQALLRPLVGGLARAGVRPNHITVGALVGSVAVGTLVILGRQRPLVLLILPAWLFLRMALNALDGMLAREHAMATRLGAVLNEMGDIVSDLSLYLPLAAVRPEAAWSAVAFALGAVLTETSGILAQALGASRRYDGPMGKSDRALVVGALGVAAVVWPPSLGWWRWVLAAAAALAVLTCLNRLRAGLGALRSREVPS